MTYSDYNIDCPTLPYDDTLENEMNNVPPEVLDVCANVGNADDFACLMDGVVGGVEDAVAFKTIAITLEELITEPLAANVQHGASGLGDPHLRTWRGEKYDFHGACDLVLLENRGFNGGLDMNVHVRTKQLKQWSFISHAVLQIGANTLEVSAGEDGENKYWINRIPYNKPLETEKILEDTISGYPITFQHLHSNSIEFEVTLTRGDYVKLGIWKKFVRVEFKGSYANFKSSRGLVGTFDGVKIARDNITVVENPDEFGQEWQVLASEPKLFHSLEGPQPPQRCLLPTAANVRRRLSGSAVSQKEAEVVCSRVQKPDFDICVFDVMATGDMDISRAY